MSVNALLRNDNGFECFSAGCSPEGKRGLSIIDVTGKNNVKNVKLKRNGKIVVVRDDNSQDRTVITYTVRDRRTGQTSNVDVVMYFGNRVPKPMRPGHPNAVFVGFQNQPTTLDGDLILNNSHDPDGDPLRLVRVYGGEHGTVQLVNGDVVYTPDPDFVGVDVFSYTIADLDSQGRVKSYAHGNHAVQIIRNPASVS
ncbi:MAG: cadherin-like domain-containing protein [Geminicoccaceae bacterium]|nr:cadherin-like domain-containing protein [Geminicoccaceae bacterium]